MPKARKAAIKKRRALSKTEILMRIPKSMGKSYNLHKIDKHTYKITIYAASDAKFIHGLVHYFEVERLGGAAPVSGGFSYLLRQYL